MPARDLPLTGTHGPGARVELDEGIALADPENRLFRLFIAAGEPFAAIDETLVAARVTRALSLRRGLGLGGKKAAYRVVHGAGDGLPGIAADQLGAWVVVWVYSRALLSTGRLVAQALCKLAPARGAILKVRSRGAAASGEVEQEILGEPPPPTLVVDENGVPFEVHPTGGLNTGLFTDMREHRHGLARFAHGRRVYNGFAYSGSLSVVCARAGAQAVTTVDLSSGVLNWARDNFRRSRLDPESPRYTFVKDDVGRALERARKARERYDLILLDPPTSSSARGAPWSIERDYGPLIARACEVLAEGGLLWLSANTRGLVPLVSFAPAGAQVLETGGLPPDHPTLPEQPADRYLQVVLLRR